MAKRGGLRRGWRTRRAGDEQAGKSSASFLVSETLAKRIAKGEVVRQSMPLTDDVRFEVGESYAVLFMRTNKDIGVQRKDPTKWRREGVRTCRVIVTAIRRQSLAEVSHTEARVEGFSGVFKLLDHYKREYGYEHPRGIDVIVVEFEVDREQRVEWMASDSSHGYTESAEDAYELEAPVARAEGLDPRWANAAAARHDDALGDERRLRGLLDQERLVEALKTKARSRHLDIRSEARSLERMLEKGDEKAVEAQIEVLRRKVDGDVGRKAA